MKSKKKIGVIVFQNIRYAPFLEFYINLLEENNIEYDVIYYNRDRKLNEIVDCSHLPVRWYGKGTNSACKPEKLINFVLYRFQLIRLLKKKKYNSLIILMTMPSILISDYLLKKYKNNFILDIRDYTFETLKFYKKIESKVVEKSALNIISSSGFKNFLPNAVYHNIHNFNKNENSNIKYQKNDVGPIRISYVGMITYEKQCIQLIKLVEKDDRFVFNFYGNENTSNLISSYIETHKCKNSKMMGPFLPDEKESIYQKSDLIFNCYGNDRILVKYAISNKFYDGAYYKVPLLTSPNTTMDELGKDFSYALDLEKISELDGLYEWYKCLEVDNYNDYANKIIECSIQENNQVKDKVLSVLND